MLTLDTILDDKGALRWFTGTVVSASDVEKGIEAEVVWDGEWEHESDRVTPDLFLGEDNWGREYMEENCWKLARRR